MATKRQSRLREWMKDHKITVIELARRLGVSERIARKYICEESIPTNRHNQFVTLGFPVELLPKPLDRKGGCKRLVPDFPGLRQEAQSATAP